MESYGGNKSTLKQIELAEVETVYDVSTFWSYFKSPKSAALQMLLISYGGFVVGLGMYKLGKSNAADTLIGLGILGFGYLITPWWSKNLFGYQPHSIIVPKKIRKVLSKKEKFSGFFWMIIPIGVVQIGFRILSEANSSYLLFLAWGICVLIAFSIFMPMSNQRILKAYKDRKGLE